MTLDAKEVQKSYVNFDNLEIGTLVANFRSS